MTCFLPGLPCGSLGLHRGSTGALAPPWCPAGPGFGMPGAGPQMTLCRRSGLYSYQPVVGPVDTGEDGR